MSAESGKYDAVVLAGGSARRFGGLDKPGQRLGARTLLDRVLDAVGDAERVVVVGPRREISRAVTWGREDPPGSGPVPALSCGLDAVRSPLVIVLAADLPFLTPDVVGRLLAAVKRGADGAVLVDDAGCPQWLVGGWHTERLRSALATAGGAGSLRSVMAPLAPVEICIDRVSGPAPWYDCDTPADLAQAQTWAAGLQEAAP